jgi:hypothetical protein
VASSLPFKPEGKRPTRIWEDNIKVDVEEIRCESVDWVYLIYYRVQWLAVVNTAMKIRGFNWLGKYQLSRRSLFYIVT